MGRTLYRGLKSLAGIFLLACVGLGQANTQSPASSPAQPGLGEQEKTELVKKLDQLLQQNQKLEDQARQVEELNRRLLDEIRQIREKLSSQPAGAQEPTQGSSEQQTAGSANATRQAAVAGPAQPDETAK